MSEQTMQETQKLNRYGQPRSYWWRVIWGTGVNQQYENFSNEADAEARYKRLPRSVKINAMCRPVHD